jgi:GMP synthase (glutamine-hydrolysing)
MEKIFIPQHIPSETLGIIEDCLAASGLYPLYIRTFEGQPVPKEMGSAAGLIIMGGPMGVYEQDRFPFLADEIRLIEQALKESKPILGICLGSQLIASALGARVIKGNHKEIGWHEIFLDKFAADDPLLKDEPSSFTAYHWHGDIFELPQGTVPLASSNLTECQGFRHVQNTYGFLFHMEITAKIIRRMVDTFREEIIKEGLDENLVKSGIQTYLPKLQSIGMNVFNRWVQLVES